MKELVLSELTGNLESNLHCIIYLYEIFYIVSQQCQKIEIRKF